MFSRQQLGGMFIVQDLSEHPGNVWFVDSTHAKASDASGMGYNPGAPFATIDYAVAACTASNGDTIYVMPNHVETIDAAGALDLDVIGISVVGLGEGDARPVLNWTAVDGTVTVDAADITVKNLRFTQGIDVIVVMWDVNADDFTMEDCEFVEAAAAQAVSLIDVDGGGANACDNLHLYRVKAIQRAAGADQVVDLAQIQDGVEIVGCHFDADCENGVVYSPAILTDVLVKDNIIKNRQAGDHAIEFSDAAIGFIIDNRLFTSALATTLDPGSCYCAGNLASHTTDVAGVPVPLAAAGVFPADSIDAAAIANDAIGATEIADAAIDVATFATDISTWQLDTATSTSALTSGTIFTWTGSIEFYIIGRVSTEIAVAATTTQITINADAVGAYAICATLDISGFDAGSLLSITGTAANAMVGTDAQSGIAPGQVSPVYVTCVTSGVIATVFGAATAGAIVWELLWRPLSAGATVTPA